jgi:hypothetical protein
MLYDSGMLTDDLTSVSIQKSNFHCDGLFCNVNVRKNDVIFVEKPNLILQSISNRTDVLVCRYCYQFIGSESIQLKILRGELTRQQLNEKNSASFSMESIVCCHQNCGELYCSSDCQQLHWAHGHKLLCTGLLTEESCTESPLMQFKIHAVQTNEIFLLVGDLFARICVEAENTSFETSYGNTLQLYEAYVRHLWWDAAVTPSEKDPVEFKSTLKSLCEESYNLLNQALNINGRHLSDILTVEYMSRSV